MIIEIDNQLGDKIAVCVVYNPPANNSIEPLKRVLSDCCAKYNDLIVLGDFNLNLLSHSARVVKFKSFISSIGLNVTISEPTNYIANKIPSQIDLVFVKKCNDLEICSQLPLGSFTSHDLIFDSYSFNMSNSLTKDCFRLRNFANINTEALFLAAKQQNFDLLFEISNIDDKVEFLTSSIFNLMESFAPEREIVINDISKPKWFSVELMRLINVRDFSVMQRIKKRAKHEKLPY